MANITEEYYSETDISVMENENPSKIARPTKRLNSAYKARNRTANLIARSSTNAGRSSSTKNPNWVSLVGPPGPFKPRRYLP